MGILRCIGSSASVSGEGGERNGSGVEVKEEKRRREERTRRREKRWEKEKKKANQMPSHPRRGLLSPPAAGIAMKKQDWALVAMRSVLWLLTWPMAMASYLSEWLGMGHHLLVYTLVLYYLIFQAFNHGKIDSSNQQTWDLDLTMDLKDGRDQVDILSGVA
jgi:hypothetical protein